jgi:nucleoside-diphosphate-sugar epimerase
MEQKEILIQNETQLEEILSEPTPEVIKVISELNGDIMILGAAGKMGPTLTKMAKRAVDKANIKKRVIAVDKIINPDLKQDLEKQGVEVITCDLTNYQELSKLPDIKNIIYMAGRKFGSTGNESLTWAINTFLPGMVAQRFANSRIVAFSTGNIYPLATATSGGSKETDTPDPIGEYAQSCLGRERMFEHFSLQNKTPVLLFRLFYAIDLRYGVLLDIGQKVYKEEPVNLNVSHLNLIWQQDANAFALQSLKLCQSPAVKLNVSSTKIFSVQQIALDFGKIFNKTPIFKNKPGGIGFICNTSKYQKLLGDPKTSLEQMIKWTAAWIKQDGKTIDKPTHFEEKDGKY